MAETEIRDVAFREQLPVFRRWRNKVGPAVAYSAIYSFPFLRFLPAIVNDIN